MEPFIFSTETTTYVYEARDMKVLREWHPRTEDEPVSPEVEAWKIVEATGSWTTAPNGTSVWSRK
jgi:hypothetical protein